MKEANIKKVSIGADIYNIEYSGKVIIRSDMNAILEKLHNNIKGQISQLNKQNNTINNNKQNKPDNKQNKEKYIKYKYNSDKHKHCITCNYNNNGNENINQFIVSNGYNHYIQNDSQINNIDSQLKIITVRNTDIGMTDNINKTNKISNYGYYFKRIIINYNIHNSKDNLEYRHNNFYYGIEKVDTDYKVIELTNLQKKKYLSNTFISKVFRDYVYFINQNKIDYKFNYHKIKNKVKFINGNEFINILSDLIRLIKTNNKRYEIVKNKLIESKPKIKRYIDMGKFDTKELYSFIGNTLKIYNSQIDKKVVYNTVFNETDLKLFKQFLSLNMNNKKIFHKNGLYKYNIEYLQYALKDIKDNGILNKDYELKRLNGIKLTDRTAITKNQVEKWNRDRIKMLKKAKIPYTTISDYRKQIIRDRALKIKYAQDKIRQIQLLHNQ